MKLIQLRNKHNVPHVAIVRSLHEVEPLQEACSMLELAHLAIASNATLSDLVEQRRGKELLDYQQLIDEARVMSPLHHPDPAHTMISGTGLTHLGSADARAAMHRKLQGEGSDLTDSMRMFRMGVEGGKPQPGTPGVQPEWFYKGDGSIVMAPGQPVTSPHFALDMGDEAEIAGLYVIGKNGEPYRLGFALGNEYSDHKMEKINYLYLAHSKLRQCAFGPEVLLGELPKDVRGMSRISRQGQVVWEKEFLSGESNMSHTIENLEHHHFKYRAFLRPGDVHVHFFGTGTLSFGDGIQTQAGDVFELESPLFGRPLRNEYQVASKAAVDVQRVTQL